VLTLSGCSLLIEIRPGSVDTGCGQLRRDTGIPQCVDERDGLIGGKGSRLACLSAAVRPDDHDCIRALQRCPCGQSNRDRRPLGASVVAEIRVLDHAATVKPRPADSGAILAATNGPSSHHDPKRECRARERRSGADRSRTPALATRHSAGPVAGRSGTGILVAAALWSIAPVVLTGSAQAVQERRRSRRERGRSDRLDRLAMSLLQIATIG
jgi:hypothetical protein